MKPSVFTVLLLFMILVLSLLTAWGRAMHDTTDEKVVYLAEIEGLIAGGTENQFLKVLSQSSDAQAIIIMIDTPGGVAKSMEKIIKKIEGSSVPIMVYVGPQGSQAFSAGTFILLSAHLAAMAPSTSIGACQPRIVNPATGLPEDAPDKEIKAYSAYIKTLALGRERNSTIAERFVTENLALNPQEALEAGVIEVVAVDVEDLLMKAHNMTIQGTLDNEKIVLDLSGARVIRVDWDARDVLINYLTDPQISSLLLTIGVLGLMFGFLTPGFHVPETVGAICIILGIYGLTYIGVNVAGILLLGLGITFFVVEALTPTFGFWATAAILSLVIGIVLIPGSDAIYQMPTEWFISFRVGSIIVVVAIGLFFAYGLVAALRAKRKKPVTGRVAMIGKKGVATTDLTPRGQVKISGEMWQAESLEGDIPKGTEIIVIEKERLVVKVKKMSSEQ